MKPLINTIMGTLCRCLLALCLFLTSIFSYSQNIDIYSLPHTEAFVIPVSEEYILSWVEKSHDNSGKIKYRLYIYEDINKCAIDSSEEFLAIANAYRSFEKEDLFKKYVEDTLYFIWRIVDTHNHQNHSNVVNIFSIEFSPTTVLPITLTSFNAVCAGRSPHIYWTTATETNNAWFILEHSTDAINFQEVTRIPGAGTSIEPNRYEYIDSKAAGGDNYYRLIQEDYDCVRTPSEIIYTNCMDDHLVHYEEPRAYIDNGIVLVGGDRLCDVYVYTILGAQRYTKRMYPRETERLNYWGHYIVEFVWVDPNTYDVRKKVYKLFNIE